MIKLYDFDGTIYDGDSSVDFFVFCFKRKWQMFILLPGIIFSMVKYKLKKITKEELKEKFFGFLKYFDDINPVVEKFWQKNKKKIKKWYVDKNKSNDIIISATPEFLLKSICDEMKVKDLIATKVDEKTGKFLSRNCYGEEKVRRLKELYIDIKVSECYSDSMSDKPILELAEKAFIVTKNEINIYK